MKTFETIYKENYNAILFFVTGKVSGNRSVAEEITNDVFLKVAEHLNEYDVEKAQLNTWIHFIANRVIIDFYRKNSNLKKNTSHISDYTDSEGKEFFQVNSPSLASEKIERFENKKAIAKAIRSVKNLTSQKVITYFFINQLKHNEISEITGISIANIKVIINRGRKVMQKSLIRQKVAY